MDLARIVVGGIGDGRDNDLQRRQPERQPAGVLFEEDADETLQGPQDGLVQHDRMVFAAVLADIGGVQPLGQHEVHLQRPQLPVAADGVAQVELQLGPVEGAFARVEHRLQAGRRGRVPERLFGLVPDFVAAGAHGRPVGELHRHLFEAEILVHAHQKVAKRLGFRCDLVLGTEDVGVVLDEGAHPHQPVQGARGFVPQTRAELGHADGKVAVAGDALAVDLHVAGAVHGLERQYPVLGLGGEHVFAELLPVARGLPQGAVHHLRGVDLYVAGVLQAGADIVLKRQIERPSPGVPEDRPGRHVLDVK